MINISPGNSSATFRINGKPYQKGLYEVLITGEQVGINRVANFDPIVAPARYSEWTDDTGTPYTSLANLQTDLEEIFFLANGTVPFAYTATNYTGLTAITGVPLGTLAYVYESQGTKWLPGTMGGTYYPDGIYVWNGSSWVSSRNAIAGELQNLLDNVANLQANKANLTDPRFPSTSEKSALSGTNGTPSNTNRYVTDSDPRNTNARTPLAHTHPISDIVNLQTVLNNKSDVGHTHTPAQVGLGNVPNIDATNPNNTVQDATHRYATDAEKATWNGKQNALGFTPENAANKGVANGYAPLGADTRVPAAFLPAYVDDVLEFANLASFPSPGTTGIIYIDIATDKEYRWTGTVYREISPSPGSTDAVPEGAANLYFTAARVLATLLNGLSLAVGTPVVATDSIIIAFGKLQAQINAILVLLPTVDQKAALAGSSGVPSAANKYVTELGLLAALTQSGVNVTRPINSTLFIPNATKYTNCRYTIRCTASISISGNQTAEFFLDTSPDGVVWTEQDSCGIAYSGGVIIGVAVTSSIRGQIETLVQPNYRARIRPNLVNGGTGTYLGGKESTIG